MADEIDVGKGIYEVRGALSPLVFNHGAELPTVPRDKLFEAINAVSPVDCLVGAMEALYAGIKQITGGFNDDIAIVCGQCAYIVGANAWHGKVDRAATIFQICRRSLGLTADETTPDPNDDPLILADYTQPEEE